MQLNEVKSFDQKNGLWKLSYWEQLQLNFHFEKWYFQLKPIIFVLFWRKVYFGSTTGSTKNFFNLSLKINTML